MKRWKRIGIGIIVTVLALVLVGGIAVYAMWRNEIASVASIKQIRERNDEHLDGAVYTMAVKGDFYLDEFVEQGGVKSDSELIAFVTDKTMMWIPNENYEDLSAAFTFDFENN